jgi:hypothetical protein
MSQLIKFLYFLDRIYICTRFNLFYVLSGQSCTHRLGLWWNLIRQLIFLLDETSALVLTLSMKQSGKQRGRPKPRVINILITNSCPLLHVPKIIFFLSCRDTPIITPNRSFSPLFPFLLVFMLILLFKFPFSFHLSSIFFFPISSPFSYFFLNDIKKTLQEDKKYVNFKYNLL